jgi:PAS domain S-box-containing protein
VLLVEDSSADARLILHELRQGGFKPEFIRVDTEADFLAQLDPGMDAVLCDYKMPQFDALRALELARERCPDVPFLIVSGSIGEETAVHAIKQGATDYVLKDRLGRLGTAVRQALEQRQLKQVQQRVEEALRASEAQYRALAESIPQLVWMARPEGRIEYVNRRVLEYTGLTLEALTGGDAMDLIHPEDLAQLMEARDAAMQTGEPPSVEFRIRRADGQYLWHITRSVAIRDPGGQILKWLGTSTDIHGQKEAADRLARDALLLASVMDSVIVTDLSGVVTYWNDGAARLFGWTAEEMIGRPYVDRFPEPIRSAIAEEIRQRAAGDEWIGEFKDYRKDGSRVFIQARVSPYTDANGKRRGILGVAYDITARRRAEEALRLRDRAIQAVSQGILITDPNQADHPIIYASPSFERLTGYTATEILGRNCRFLQGKDTDPAAVSTVRTAVREGGACAVELLNYRKDGTPFWNALTVDPVRDGDRLTHFVGVQTDVTERRRLEAQYRQGQKMEAFGQLAGGVAHDFNNLLTVINGCADLLLAEFPLTDPRHESLTAIREAGERAAGLTAQLLAFSRKTMVEPKILDLNQVVEQMGKMLRRLIGEDIVFVPILAPGVCRVKMDRGQLDQVIMNLSINARDAMPTGGRLTIETKNAELRPENCPAGGDYRPGRYVRLTVSDTGCGMTDAVKAKIFEPFFTTKEVGKGSGLGLATVYGIAKTYGGHVEVWSELDRGTRITVLLPAVVAAPSPATANRGMPVPQGNETLLIVEDEPAVRKFMRTALERHGYKVLEAKDGTDALQVAERHGGPIHLLLTDVVMPGMGGREIAKQILARHADVRVLYLSGYTDDAVVRHGVVEAIDAFLQKPFTPSALASKVRNVLDGTKPLSRS